MNPQSPQFIQIAITVIIVLVVVGLRLRRMNQLRPLRLELMWIMPAILFSLFALTVYFARPNGSDWLWIVAIGAVGAAVGWYRGKMMQIHVDPETHALNQKASPLAMIIILVILAVRYGLRAEATTFGLNINLVTDSSIAFAAAMFTAVRIEMFIRAKRMLAEARAGGPTPPTVS